MRRDFDPKREAAFRADYATKSLSSVRFGLVLGGTLYAIFAPLDIWMLPESWRGAFAIRFGIVLPVCLTAIALTLGVRWRPHLQTIAAVFVIAAGLGIVGMIALARETEPGFRYYYAGLLLVLTYSFTVVRLRFLPTTLCCLSVIAAYELVAVADQGLLTEGLLNGGGPVFLNNNFFLLAAGIITLIGSYILEDYARQDFTQRNELANTLDELKATQTQLIQIERTTAMGSVVAGLLHELNTPVGAIASAADVVNRGTQILKDLDRGPDRSANEAVARKWEKTIALIDDNRVILHGATERVRHTLEVLKRFTHLDKAETAEFDVNKALEDCLTLLARDLGDNIVVERKFGELPKIRCRPGEINQLFMSVLKNAVEAIPDRGTIELRTSAEEGLVRVDVTDTGVGIPEERLKDLFLPKFSRNRSRIKLGLGLVTSNNVVHRHGGSIRIESAVGKGTQVSVTLPEVSTGPRSLRDG